MKLGDWTLAQLTHGSAEGRFHAHSYYDIPVFSPDSRLIAAHRMAFAERWMTPEDAVDVGVVPVEGGGFEKVGESRAWSWQQGPMAQWTADGRLVWNDRDGDRFVARAHDPARGTTATLPRPVYALDPAGRFALSLNMARLDSVRPGYGYVGGAGALLDRRFPADDGVWRMDLATGEARLILSVRRALAFAARHTPLRAILRHVRRAHIYWFNHAKIAPDGRRFTVKLRFRLTGGRDEWRDAMSVSLTCGIDGADLRLLAWGPSHVIWRDPERLYFWHSGKAEMMADRAPRGALLHEVGPGVITANVHLRRLPGSPEHYVFDTPYREDVDLRLYDAESGARATIAQFRNHRPALGPFRCDLHPVPSPDGRRIVVTSLQDCGRQLYLLSR